MHSTELKRMHETLVWCMHEKVNDYAGDLIKLFLNRLQQKIFKLFKKHSYSLSIQAHGLDSEGNLSAWALTRIWSQVVWLVGRGGTMWQRTYFSTCPVLGDHPTPSPPLPSS